MHGLVELMVRKKARVLLGDIQIFDSLCKICSGRFFIFQEHRHSLLIIRVPQIGIGYGELLVDDLLVFRKGQHIFKLDDSCIEIILLIHVQLGQSVTGIGIIRIAFLGTGIRLNGGIDIAALLGHFAHFHIIFYKNDFTGAGQLDFGFLKFHHALPVPVFTAGGKLNLAESKIHEFSIQNGCLPDFDTVDIDIRTGRLRFDLKQCVGNLQDKFLCLLALIDADHILHGLVSVT